MSGACPTSPFPSKISLRSITRTLTSSSMSGKKFSRAFGVQLWALDVEWPPMTRAEFDPIYAFFLSQEGSYGTFTFAAHDRLTPRGTASSSPTGAPLVRGASQTGTSLAIDGLPNSHTGWLLPGDLLTINGNSKVYMATASVDSNGSGQATVSLNCPLVASPADNAAITIVNVPFTVCLLDEIQEYQIDQPNIYVFKASFLEAL